MLTCNGSDGGIRVKMASITTNYLFPLASGFRSNQERGACVIGVDVTLVLALLPGCVSKKM